MKKIAFFALAALSLTLASCNKEQIQPAPENGNTFTMTLNASVEQTKATISDEWKFAFTEGDNISLTNNQTTDYYTVTRGSDGKFTGTVDAPQSEATWYAYYPSHDVSFANQTGTQAGAAAYYAYSGKQENVAAGSKNLDITLNPQTAILVIGNQSSTMDISVQTADGKWVSGLTAKSGDATFDVTKSDTKVSLFSTTAKGTYYIVVPAGVQIAIFDGDTKIKETKAGGLAPGKYYRIIRYIADVLATVDGGFPKGDGYKIPSDDAWVSITGKYAFVIFDAALNFLTSDKENSKYVVLNTEVTPGENCYTATTSNSTTLTFKMTNGKLTSIIFSSTEDVTSDRYNGIYTTAPPVLPDGALSGVFSVSDTKKVCFSKGNLWYDKVGSATTDTWNFETNQYDISSTWNPSHISNFYWSKTASKAYSETYSDTDAQTDEVLFTNATETTSKANVTINGMNGFWRTLSQAEWQYLLANHQYKYLSVNGKYGIVIAPDGFSGTIADSYSATDWTTAEAAGFVFLPSTGFREGSYISEVNPSTSDEISCIYWTSTAGSDDEAYRMFFKWDDSKPEGSKLITDFDTAGYRYWAVGIRLVTDVK